MFDRVLNTVLINLLPQKINTCEFRCLRPKRSYDDRTVQGYELLIFCREF